MALTLTLGTQVVPHIRITIPGTDLPAGAVWELGAWFQTPAGGPASYRVRGGSGIGAAAQVVLVDVAAPVNVPVYYYTIVNGVTGQSASITRTYAGGTDVLQSADGARTAAFRWMAEGGDPRQPVIRAHASDVAGRRRPPVRIDPVVGDGGGSLVADTSGNDTATLRALLGSPSYLLHNAAACQIPGCDIPLTDMVLIMSATHDRTARIDAAHRRWSLSYLLVDDPEPTYVVPLSTWDTVDELAYTWNAMDALAYTWDVADRTDWSTVG